MAIKDVYVPYEKWLEQVVSVEDFVIADLFKKMFLHPDMIHYCGDCYILQYPFNMSYLAHCIEVYQDKDLSLTRLGEVMRNNCKGEKLFDVSIKYFVSKDDHSSYILHHSGVHRDDETVFGDDWEHEVSADDVIDEINSKADPSVVISPNFNTDLMLPIAITKEYTFSRFMQSRIMPIVATMISSETYDIIKDYGCILNKDRNDAWVYNPLDACDLSVQYMQNLTARVKFHVFGGYKIYISINGETFDIGDADTEEEAKSICDKIVSQINQNVSTIYPFEWSEY